MALVASFYHLPPQLLPAIQAVEGGRVGAVSMNTNGTADLGLMQVNTVWLPPLSRAARLPSAEVGRRLIRDPCFSIAAAGFVLRAYLNETHGNMMLAIGDYHSHTPALNQMYRTRVLETATQMFAKIGSHS
jgi:hypothetical protein